MLDNGYIIAITTGYGQIQISDDDYSRIYDLIQQKPTAPNGYDYALKDNTLEWELVALPPEPEPVETDPTADEILNIIMGVSE